MKFSCLPIFAVATAFAQFPLHAATIFNGSFEDTTGSPALPDGWNPSGNLAVLTTQGATSGSKAVAFSWDNQPSNGEISQTFATTTSTGYRLLFDFGKYSVNQAGLTARLLVDIYDGADFTGSVLFTDGVEDATNLITGFYNQFQFDFTAQGAMTTLRFRDSSDAQSGGGGFDAMLDNVSVEVIPEPSAFALLGTACISFLAFTRRRG